MFTFTANAFAVLHTHTHTQPFYGSLDFVWDNPAVKKTVGYAAS